MPIPAMPDSPTGLPARCEWKVAPNPQHGGGNCLPRKPHQLPTLVGGLHLAAEPLKKDDTILYSPVSTASKASRDLRGIRHAKEQHVSFRTRKEIAILTIHQTEEQTAATEAREALKRCTTLVGTPMILILEVRGRPGAPAIKAEDDGKEGAVAKCLREVATAIESLALPMVCIAEGVLNSALTQFVTIADEVLMEPSTQLTLKSDKIINASSAFQLGLATHIVEAKNTIMECAKLCQELARRTPELAEMSKNRRRDLRNRLFRMAVSEASPPAAGA